MTNNNLFKIDYEYGELNDAGTAVDTSKNIGMIARTTTTIPTTSFTQTFKYDAINRLTEARELAPNNAQNWKQTFGYDRFGNRTGFSQQINNQELAINSQTLPSVNPDTNRFNLNQGFEYDKSGNVIKDIDRVTGLQRSFTFNAENKQVHVKDANNAPVGTYYYDGSGNRVKKTTATETTIFVYDGSGKMVAEYSTQQSANPTGSYLTTDHLGTPRVITDKNGNVTSRRDFLPFGEEIGVNTAQTVGRSSNPQYGASDNVRQKFTGNEKDNETNLDFADARYYDGKFGRFTAVDPLLASGKSTDPQTFNRYTYALNSPLLMIDGTGEKPVYVSGMKGHQKYTDYYVKGSTRYEGGRIKVFGSANGGKNAWYIITRNGIFSANSKTQLNNANGGGSGNQATKRKGSDALPARSRELAGAIVDGVKQKTAATALAAPVVGAGVACWFLCGPALAAGGAAAIAHPGGVAGAAIGTGLVAERLVNPSTACATGSGSLNGCQNYQVFDPTNKGRIVTDIDRIESNSQGTVLWEEKSAINAINRITGADETQDWVAKQITNKFNSIVEARSYLPSDYANAEIGFDFTSPNADPIDRF